MAYGPNDGPAITPPIEETIIIRPLFLVAIFGNTAWVIARVPNTLTSNRCLTRSIGTSAIGPVCPAPALLIRTSTSNVAAFATSTLEVISSFSTCI
ncbi:unannotated protein [freshwater metagenome]|uniref:Unannotated protein n=1 Tax=freshwater metagenome TaxID=449393 RepID=A0A6J6UJW6_9ZZZZ